jgi:hypothetical protein
VIFAGKRASAETKKDIRGFYPDMKWVESENNREVSK